MKRLCIWRLLLCLSGGNNWKINLRAKADESYFLLGPRVVHPPAQDNHDDDLYIIGAVCISVCNEKVTTSWIVGDDDIYAAQIAILLIALLQPTCCSPLGNANNWQLIVIIMNINCHEDDDWLWSANICWIRFTIVAVCLFVKKILFPSELSAAGAKRGVRC